MTPVFFTGPGSGNAPSGLSGTRLVHFAAFRDPVSFFPASGGVEKSSRSASCVIIRYLKIPGPKLSCHLNILRECGLIEGVSQGNWII